MNILQITTVGQHDRALVVRSLLERGWKDGPPMESMLDTFCGSYYGIHHYTLIVLSGNRSFRLWQSGYEALCPGVTAEDFMQNMLAYNEY